MASETSRPSGSLAPAAYARTLTATPTLVSLPASDAYTLSRSQTTSIAAFHGSSSASPTRAGQNVDVGGASERVFFTVAVAMTTATPREMTEVVLPRLIPPIADVAGFLPEFVHVVWVLDRTSDQFIAVLEFTHPVQDVSRVYL
jgi:hypothetical protein